ncbi:hypothetical protein LTR62_007793 [Meristemomyces frigidus]|uniref:alpha-glucosidase n=1 Tax=Meristemomyces frigidus TaxID=1508187 RepID=A0AAN7TIJ9_9PEZI|nr:hypothetical protein LTR62_007793 [Meristemomyces frigidus]
MPQDERVPTHYERVVADKNEPGRLHLCSKEYKEQVDFTFETLGPGLFRTTFSSRNHPLPPFPSARTPAAPDVSSLCVSHDDGSPRQSFVQAGFKADVVWRSEPLVSIGFVDQEPLHRDLPLRSYALDGPGIAHYTAYARADLHLGLGEKAAPMDLSNRHFTLSATDCFGYDVHRSDPMYKHIPLLVHATPKGVLATFSTSHARGYYSVGSEMDGMWGYFKVYRQDYGGLEEYTMIGHTLQEVVHLYAQLVGFPQLVPRWAFGYLAGGMKYSMLDSPPAHEALMEFADKMKEHDIPCSGFQMSSGYTVAEQEPKTRNVFTWNRHRFPDPKAFCHEFHRRGIRLIANIKPYVLANHPAYPALEEQGAFFTDPRTSGTGIARLWSAGGGTSGEGGHIDFTSTAGWDFWYKGVQELRRTGMDCMWNDNNEYLIPSDTWQLALTHPAALEGINDEAPHVTARKDVGLWGRAMQTELHAACSHSALRSAVPHERPFILTRSATAGTMRYACSTWSGDNTTSWAGMLGSNALSLNAGISLLQNYGHDIGGFEGPQPSPELLLRWVQMGCYSPRFAINCYKTGRDSLAGDVIEPWMYPEITPCIREAIKRRYEIIPYLYSLMLQSTRTAIPPQRWTGWGYETDNEVWTNTILKQGETQYWLGDTLLVAGVFEPGAQTATVYLPRKHPNDPGYLNTNAPYQYLEPGTWHTVAAPYPTGSIPVLARIGGAIPVGKREQVAAGGDRVNEGGLPADDWRGVEIFPPPATTHPGQGGEQASREEVWYTSTWFEDDGISPATSNSILSFSISYTVMRSQISMDSTEVVKVRIMLAIGEGESLDGFVPSWLDKGLHIIMPMGDERVVVVGGGSVGTGEGLLEEGERDGRGRSRWVLSRHRMGNGEA